LTVSAKELSGGLYRKNINIYQPRINKSMVWFFSCTLTVRASLWEKLTMRHRVLEET
jgi:hypothetical protein